MGVTFLSSGQRKQFTCPRFPYMGLLLFSALFFGKLDAQYQTMLVTPEIHYGLAGSSYQLSVIAITTGGQREIITDLSRLELKSYNKTVATFDLIGPAGKILLHEPGNALLRVSLKQEDGTNLDVAVTAIAQAGFSILAPNLLPPSAKWPQPNPTFLPDPMTFIPYGTRRGLGSPLVISVIDHNGHPAANKRVRFRDAQQAGFFDELNKYSFVPLPGEVGEVTTQLKQRNTDSWTVLTDLNGLAGVGFMPYEAGDITITAEILNEKGTDLTQTFIIPARIPQLKASLNAPGGTFSNQPYQYFAVGDAPAISVRIFDSWLIEAIATGAPNFASSYATIGQQLPIQARIEITDPDGKRPQATEAEITDIPTTTFTPGALEVLDEVNVAFLVNKIGNYTITVHLPDYPEQGMRTFQREALEPKQNTAFDYTANNKGQDILAHPERKSKTVAAMKIISGNFQSAQMAEGHQTQHPIIVQLYDPDGQRLNMAPIYPGDTDYELDHLVLFYSVDQSELSPWGHNGHLEVIKGTKIEAGSGIPGIIAVRPDYNGQAGVIVKLDQPYDGRRVLRSGGCYAMCHGAYFHVNVAYSEAEGDFLVMKRPLQAVEPYEQPAWYKMSPPANFVDTIGFLKQRVVLAGNVSLDPGFYLDGYRFEAGNQYTLNIYGIGPTDFDQNSQLLLLAPGISFQPHPGHTTSHFISGTLIIADNATRGKIDAKLTYQGIELIKPAALEVYKRLPDLVINQQAIHTATATAESDGNLALSFTVYNKGEIDSGGFQIGLFDGPVTPADIKQGVSIIPELEVNQNGVRFDSTSKTLAIDNIRKGESMQIDVYVNPELTKYKAMKGIYYIIDPLGQLEELSKRNNQAYQLFHDLEIEEIYAIQSVDNMPLVEHKATMFRVAVKMTGVLTKTLKITPPISLKITLNDQTPYTQTAPLTNIQGETYVLDFSALPSKKMQINLTNIYQKEVPVSRLQRHMLSYGIDMFNINRGFRPSGTAPLKVRAQIYVGEKQDFEQRPDDLNISNDIAYASFQVLSPAFEKYTMGFTKFKTIGFGYTPGFKYHQFVTQQLNFLNATYPISKSALDAQITYTPLISLNLSHIASSALWTTTAFPTMAFIVWKLGWDIGVMVATDSMMNDAAGLVNRLYGNIVILNEIATEATLAHEVGHLYKFCEEYKTSKGWGECGGKGKWDNVHFPKGVVAGDGWDVLLVTAEAQGISRQPAKISLFPDDTYYENADLNRYNFMNDSDATPWISYAAYEKLLKEFTKKPDLLTSRLTASNPYAYSPASMLANTYHVNSASLSLLDNSNPLPRPSKQWIIARGVFHRLETRLILGAFSITERFPSLLIPLPTTQKQLLAIKLLDSDKNTLTTQYFANAQQFKDTAIIPFSIATPWVSTAQTIQIWYQDTLLSETPITAKAPQIEFVHVDTSSTDYLTINWAVKDSTRPTDQVLALFSPNQGSSWIPLTSLAHSNSPTLEIDKHHLPGCDYCHVKLIVTDGVRDNEKLSAPFRLPNQKPQVELRMVTPSPNDNDNDNDNHDTSMDTTLLPPYILAEGYDIEDGMLKANNIKWYSHLDGYLQTGNLLVPSNHQLAAGEHQITVEVSDSNAQQTTATILYVVE